MKKVLFILLTLIISGCASHTNDKLEDLIDIISEKQNDIVFKDLNNCLEFDPEAKLIFDTKAKIDESQLQLIKLVDFYYSSEDLSTTLNFTNYILKFYAFGETKTSTNEIFKGTIQHLMDFLSTDKANDTEYQSFKRLVINNDEQILDTQTSLLRDLTAYQDHQKTLSGVLEDVLTFVTNKDLKGAAERFKGDDVQQYYLEAAHVLNSYYDYLVSRAVSIKNSYELYKSKNGN